MKTHTPTLSISMLMAVGKGYSKISLHAIKYLLAPAIVLTAVSSAHCQDFTQIKTPSEPLVLESVGSFYVGGESVLQSKEDLGNFAPGGHVTVGQMYVQFMKPHKKANTTSFVLIHGMTLTGKTYETTPDGRMGWNEYFVRKGYDTHVVDQFGVGRSGFDSKAYNDVKSGQSAPEKQSAFIRIPDENALVNFRIGTATNGHFKDARFSPEAFREFSKQGVPYRPTMTDADNLRNYQNLSILTSKIKNTILVSHSQSGSFPLKTALLDATGIKGAVLLEPGGPAADFSDEDAKKLAKVPFLVVFADHLDNDTGMAHRWKQFYIGWKAFVAKVNAAGGHATMLYLPDAGIKGNGHMLMQEENNLQIADLILKWADKL
jgi:pimeloyl-ACP methyl ester carboxylesterase